MLNLSQTEATIYAIQADVNEGNINALEAWTKLRLLASQLDEVIDTLQPLAVQQADNYNGKQFEAFGVKFEKREGTRRWSYPEFTPLMQAKERAKAIESLMQNVYATGKELVDMETGELIPAATCTFSKPTLAIKGAK
jgi:ribosomal protein L22